MLTCTWSHDLNKPQQTQLEKRVVSCVYVSYSTIEQSTKRLQKTHTSCTRSFGVVYIRLERFCLLVRNFNIYAETRKLCQHMHTAKTELCAVCICAFVREWVSGVNVGRKRRHLTKPPQNYAPEYEERERDRKQTQFQYIIWFRTLFWILGSLFSLCGWLITLASLMMMMPMN